MTEVFNYLFVYPVLNILVFLYKLFFILKIPGSFGFAVISLTIIIRFLLYPLNKKQLKLMSENARKMAFLKPQLARLSEKYKNDKARLSQEQMRLYKETGINPAAGCLPNLLQLPILIALYSVFVLILSTNNLSSTLENINKIVYFPFLKVDVLDLSFFGLNLASRPAQWQKFGWFLLFIPPLTALLQYWQVKMMTPPKRNQESRIKNQEEKKKEEDMGEMMQKQMNFMLPLMIGFFAFEFPLGLSLYWNTYTLFGIIQQYQINKEERVENGQKRK